MGDVVLDNEMPTAMEAKGEVKLVFSGAECTVSPSRWHCLTAKPLCVEFEKEHTELPPGSYRSTRMPLPITYAVRTASYRSNSEDRAVALALDGRLVLLLADGSGGIPGGSAAADVVVDFVNERAAELPDVQSCVDMLRAADPLVMSTGGETTAELLVIDENGISGASGGDSEAWIVKDDGAIDDLTERQHLKKRLGSGRAAPVGFERRRLLRGTMIVGTDGLFRYAMKEAIVEVVLEAETPDEARDWLVELVRPRGGKRSCWMMWAW